MAPLSELAASSLRASSRSSRRHRLHNPARSRYRPRIQRPCGRRPRDGCRGVDAVGVPMGSEQQCRLDDRCVWYQWNWKWFGRIHRRSQYRGHTDGNATPLVVTRFTVNQAAAVPSPAAPAPAPTPAPTCSGSCSGSCFGSSSDSLTRRERRLRLRLRLRLPLATTRFRQTTRRWRNPRERGTVQSPDNQHLRVDSQ